MIEMNNLTVSMSTEGVDSSDRAKIVNRLAEQLACTTMDYGKMDDDSDSDTAPPTSLIFHRNPGGLESEEEKCKASDDSIDDDHSDDPNSPKRTPHLNYDDEEASVSPYPAAAPPRPTPIDKANFYYHEHNRRLEPTHVSRLNNLLQTPAGMRIFSLYSTWLDCSGWELHDFPVPPPGRELEVLSLAMAVEIYDRWAARNLREDMVIWGVGRLGKRKGFGRRVRREGMLPPMSPFDHPFHPYWLPEPEAEEEEEDGDSGGKYVVGS